MGYKIDTHVDINTLRLNNIHNVYWEQRRAIKELITKYEELNDPLAKNTLFYLTSSIAPLLTIYGVGLQGVSDLLTKLYTESCFFKKCPNKICSI